MARASGESYKYAPRISDKPNAQGTLFQATSPDVLDPTGKRYPRGYTPQRSREVEDALADTHISDLRRESLLQRNTTAPITASRATDWVKQDIKRSTVSPEHLHGLGAIMIKSEDDRHDSEAASYAHTVGHPEDLPDITVHPDVDHPLGSTAMAHSLIHEIGHHVGNLSGSQFQQWDEAGLGHDEADSDNFAVEHARSDRRAPSWDRNIASTSAYEEDPESYGSDFAHAYRNKRGMPHPNQQPEHYLQGFLFNNGPWRKTKGFESYTGEDIGGSTAIDADKVREMAAGEARKYHGEFRQRIRHHNKNIG